MYWEQLLFLDDQNYGGIQPQGDASVPLAIEKSKDDDGEGNSDSEGDDGMSRLEPGVDDNGDVDSEGLRDSDEDEDEKKREVRRLARLKERREVSAGEKLSISLPRHHEVITVTMENVFIRSNHIKVIDIISPLFDIISYHQLLTLLMSSNPACLSLYTLL